MPVAISLDESTPHTLLPFLHSQSQSTLTRLYQRPSSCLSIFRSVIFLRNFYTTSRLICARQITGTFGETNRHESFMAGIRHTYYNYDSMGHSGKQKVH